MDLYIYICIIKPFTYGFHNKSMEFSKQNPPPKFGVGDFMSMSMSMMPSAMLISILQNRLSMVVTVTSFEGYDLTKAPLQHVGFLQWGYPQSSSNDLNFVLKPMVTTGGSPLRNPHIYHPVSGRCSVPRQAQHDFGARDFVSGAAWKPSGHSDGREVRSVFEAMEGEPF